MEEMRQALPCALSPLSALSRSANSRAQTYSHTYRQNYCKVLHQGILSLLFQVNKGALHSQRNLSSVSFRIKKLKNEAKGARRSLWLETSKPQAFLSGLNVELRPEGHEEAYSALALF